MGAKKEMELALQSGRRSPRVLRNAAWISSLLGNQDQALHLVKEAVNIDPLQPWSFRWLSIVYLSRRQYDSALYACRRMLSLSKDFVGGHELASSALFFGGRIDEARTEFDQIPIEQVQSGPRFEFECLLEFANGNKVKSDLILKSLRDAYAKNNPYKLAAMYAYRGESSESIKWLESAFEKKTLDLKDILVNPAFDPIREDLRFKAFVQRMGFPE